MNSFGVLLLVFVTVHGRAFSRLYQNNLPGSMNGNPYTGPTNTASNGNGGTGTTAGNGNIVGKNGGFPAGPNNANNAVAHNEPMNEQYSPAVDKTAILQSTINALLQNILQKQSYDTNPQVVYINGHDQVSGSRSATNIAATSTGRGKIGSIRSVGNSGSTGAAGNSGNTPGPTRTDMTRAGAKMPNNGAAIAGASVDMHDGVGDDMTRAHVGPIGDGILIGRDFGRTNNDMFNNINRYNADIDSDESYSSNTNNGKYGQVKYI